MSLVVRTLDDASADAWDKYVFSHPKGTFCHRAGWKKVVEEGAGQTCHFLFVEQDGSIAGIMPLTLRKSTLFGKLAISGMFGVYGGALASSGEAYDALDEAAWRIAREAGCDVLECRTKEARHKGMAAWVTETGKAATFIRKLETGDEQTMLLQIPRKQRAVVRKSLKNDLLTDWKGSVNEFYDLYARSVKGLGTPVFPKRLFSAFQAHFQKDVVVQITRDGKGHGVASLMSFVHGDTILPYYAGSGARARALAAHDFMYFELMCHAASMGCNTFDFGRSKVETGPYRFKKNWGFEPTPLEYEFRLVPGAAPPDISPQNRKYQFMIALWKRLPLVLANMLGPPIARHLG